MPKKKQDIEKMTEEQKRVFADVEAFMSEAQKNEEVINIEWSTYDGITDYCGNLIDLYGKSDDFNINNSLALMKSFDSFLHQKPDGSDKTNFELIAEANGGKYAEFAELLNKLNTVLDLGMHIDSLPRPDIKEEQNIINEEANIINEEPVINFPVLNMEEVRKDTVEGFRDYIKSDGSGATARTDKMLELNSYLKNNLDDNSIAGYVRDAMKQELFLTDDKGNIDYSKAEEFFTALGRNAFNTELDGLSSISKDPKAIQDKAYIKATEIEDLLATAKAMAADDENIRKFNDNLDEYNKNKEDYEKAKAITPEQIQKWYDAGREYQLGRSKGYAKQNLLKNAAKIREDAKKALNLDDDGLKAKQNEAMAKYAADCKKKVEDKYVEIVKNGPRKAAERKQKDEIKPDDQIKIGEQPDDKINVSDGNININELAKENAKEFERKIEIQKALNKPTDTEVLLTGLDSVSNRIKDLDLKTDSAKTYANTWVEELGDTETALRNNKRPDHQNSTDYFEPMINASVEVRGIGNVLVNHEEAIDRYDELINRCDRYISKRSWGWFDRFKSDEGRERIRLARQLKAYAVEMKENYLNKAVRDEYNEAVKDFAGSDFSSMTQDQILDKITNVNNLESRIYNRGMNLEGMQSVARQAVSKADDKLTEYTLKKSGSATRTDDILMSRVNNTKKLSEILNEEKGIRKTDSKKLANKLGIHQGVKHSGHRRSNANNNIIEDVKENTNKKQIRINS